MVRSITAAIAAMSTLLQIVACGPPETNAPDPWDCGDTCVAGCAFLSPSDHNVCIEDCKVCDGRDSTVFTGPPILGLPVWNPLNRYDAGAD